MAVERAGRKPVSSHPRFWKRCDWGPFSMKGVSAIHRSLLYNVSYFDLPMDISTHVTNITYAIRANYPRKLSPAVTLYDYHPPSLNEVVLTVNSTLAAYMPTQTNCPNDFDITDAVVRYPLVPEADHHTVHWWLYQGMNFDNFTHVRWVGSLPYYTYMLLPGPDNEWAMYDIISHNILKNHTDVVDNSFVHPVFEYQMNFDTCGTKSPLDPCLGRLTFSIGGRVVPTSGCLTNRQLKRNKWPTETRKSALSETPSKPQSDSSVIMAVLLRGAERGSQGQCWWECSATLDNSTEFFRAAARSSKSTPAHSCQSSPLLLQHGRSVSSKWVFSHNHVLHQTNG